MRREKFYQITMSIAKRMLADGLISKEEYAIIDTKMKEKYQPTLGTLFADIDLI
nr:MAG TPA: Short C-terminal domain [Caudoviricetes sp.]